MLSCISASRRHARVHHSPDDTVSTLAQLLGHIVLFVHDEVLVKHLEDLATLQIGHGGRGLLL